MCADFDLCQWCNRWAAHIDPQHSYATIYHPDYVPSDAEILECAITTAPDSEGTGKDHDAGALLVEYSLVDLRTEILNLPFDRDRYPWLTETT